MKNISNIARKMLIPILVIIVLVGVFVGILSFQEGLKEPEITISEPKEGISTEAESLQVKGKTNSTSNQVFVNGDQAEIADDGSFVADVPLEEGKNDVLVEAVSKSGKSISQGRPVTRSKTTPTEKTGEVVGGEVLGSNDVPADTPATGTKDGGSVEVLPESKEEELTEAGPKENATLVIGSLGIILYYYIKSKKKLVETQRS